MQEVSQKFRELWETPGKLTDVKFEINGVEYFNDAIYPSALSRRMFANDEPSVGSVVQGTFSSSVILKSDIPKHATVKVYNRVVDPDNGEASEWIQRGEFYINSRKGYRAGSELEFTAKDAIGKTNKPYIAYTAFRTWPQNENAVVAEIAQIIGVTVDSRTVLLGYPVPYPNDYTMREILGYIAAANCGNWTITDKNELRLVPFTEPSYPQTLLAADANNALAVDTTIIELFTGTYPIRVQKNVDSFADLGIMDAYTGVRVWSSDQDYFEAGDDTGIVLECDCPWATQAMANTIYSAIVGYSLHAYSATYADIPPSAEIGDIVRIDGVDYQIFEYDISLDGTHQPDIGAPAYDESEEDYEPELQRQLKRTVKLGQNYFGTTIDRKNGVLVQLYNSAGEPTGAYAKFNANALEFVKNDGSQAIYFDPTTGEYIFNGKLIVRDGMLQLQGASQLVKVRYATDKAATIPSGWSENWNTAWDNDTTEVWAIYSYDLGATWKSPVMIQGKRGPRGYQGDPASVPDWVRAYTSSAQYDTLVTNEWVIAMNLYGSKIFAGSSDDEYALMTSNGLQVFNANALLKIWLGLETGGSLDTPFLQLGAGDTSTGANAGLVEKFANGIWVGSSQAKGSQNEPASVSGNGNTGIFVDFSSKKIYRYINGVRTDISEGGSPSTVVAVWG
ncbi:MAG: hypothetical protein IJP43_07565 [Oscillospiraceae bacterium]|nr:hypothetical protein [Oscillospiraceae bacterium]